MRRAFVLFALFACARAPSTKDVDAPRAPRSGSSTTGSSSAALPASRSPSTSTGLGRCLAVAEDGAGPPATVEGTVGAAKDGLFTLRLTKPRCVVGLAGASFVADVAIVSTGFDLRPLVGARVRASGEAIAGQTDMGGPAVVVMVKDVDRLPAGSDEDEDGLPTRGR